MQNTPEMPPYRQSGAVSGPLVLAIIAALMIAIAAYFLFSGTPGEHEAPLTVPSTTAEERGDNAREVIAELKQESTPPDIETAYEQARENRAAGRLADAQLLYFFAARGGHASAAFDLATMYDPAYFNSDTSVMNKADAFQAYKWYKQARDGGYAQAGTRIADLRTWAMNAANDGDAEAERLIISMGTE